MSGPDARGTIAHAELRAYSQNVHRRLTLSILMLLALLVAPFGRMAAAEAATMPHHQAPAMAGHCSEMPAPEQAPAERGTMTIDCLVACATIAAPETPVLAAVEALVVSPASRALTAFIGIHLEADPPPPRRA